MTDYVVPERYLAVAAILEKHARELQLGMTRTDSVADDLRLLADVVEGSATSQTE